MYKKARKTTSGNKEHPALHSAIAFLTLVALVCAATLLLPRFGLAGKGASRLASSVTPAPFSAIPNPTREADTTDIPHSAVPSETPSHIEEPNNSLDPESFVETRLVIDGVPFASLASRQAVEELINTAVSQFEQLCPGTNLVTKIENSIEYVDASSSDSITSFDEALQRLTAPDSPLVVRSILTRSDLETLPCSSSEQASDRFYLGTRFVSAYGRDGKKLLVNEYTYVNGVLSAFKLLEESVLTEPIDEIVLIGTRAIPSDDSPSRDFGFSECEPTSLSFVPPVDALVVELFGFQHGVFHRGIGFSCDTGTVCSAPCGGTVSALLPRGSLGLTLELSHGGGIVTRYTNLQSSNVSVGDALIEGDMIGRVGDGGLHFEVLVNGIPRNPLYYLNDVRIGG